MTFIRYEHRPKEGLTNSELIDFMNDYAEIFTPPRDDGFKGGHDHYTLFDMADAKFFFKEESQQLDLFEKSFDHMNIYSKYFIDEKIIDRYGEIIYEDEWQIAVKIDDKYLLNTL